MNLRKDHWHESLSIYSLQVPLVAPAALFLPPRAAPVSILFSRVRGGLWSLTLRILSLAAVDALARVSMKDAANCDTHSDVRNSENL